MINKLCRLCLRQDDNSESLIDLVPEDLIPKALVEIFNIKVNKEDTKPKAVCAWCKDKVIDFYLFFLRVKSNETKLEREAVALKIKTEPGTAPIIPTTTPNVPKIDTSIIVLDSDDDDDTTEKTKDKTTEIKTVLALTAHVKTEPGAEKKRKAVENNDQESPSVKKTKNKSAIPSKTSHSVEVEVTKTKNTILPSKDRRLSMTPKVIVKRLPLNPPLQTSFKLKQSSLQPVSGVTPQPSKSNSTPIKPRNNTAPTTSTGFAEKLKLLKKNHESMSDDQMIKVFYDLKCNICEMELEFYSFQALAEHYKTDHQEENYRVECCEVKIPRNLLLIHIRHHLGLEKLSLMQHVEQLKTQFFCDYCSETFFKDYILRLHMKFEHGPGKVVKAKKKIDKQPYVCDLCGRTFPYLHNLRVHIQTIHLKLSVYSCNICNIGFSHYKKLQSHKLKQHAIKPKVHSTTCHICEKPCPDRFHLQEHIFSHLGVEEKKQVKKFNCKYCDFKSYLISKVKDHESKRHINKKPDFECNVCHKFLDSRLQLYMHLMTHLDKDEQDKLKPHQCIYCDMRFMYESGMHAHISSHHRCNICKEIVKPPQTMGDHTRDAHKKFIINNKGSKKYPSTGSFLCAYCDKPFRSNDRLKVHLREWHLGGSLYECDWCDAQFNDKRAFESHKMKFHSDKLDSRS